MEKLVQQEPKNVNLRLQLTDLYEITGQTTKAETAYNQVLAQQNDNLKALLGKARLRYVQGDIKTASALFSQAEKVAPDNLKAEVQALAQKTLGSPVQ
jgi:tetratricopeptide (TPR) repeat protein